MCVCYVSFGDIVNTYKDLLFELLGCDHPQVSSEYRVFISHEKKKLNKKDRIREKEEETHGTF